MGWTLVEVNKDELAALKRKFGSKARFQLDESVDPAVGGFFCYPVVSTW